MTVLVLIPNMARSQAQQVRGKNGGNVSDDPGRINFPMPTEIFLSGASSVPMDHSNDNLRRSSLAMGLEASEVNESPSVRILLAKGLKG